MDKRLKQIVNYVKENYSKLPKSNFSGDECIIVFVESHEDDGYSHSFNGLGVTKEGIVKWYFSSGCSCNGGTNSSDATMKQFTVDDTPYDEIFKEWFKNNELVQPPLTDYSFDDY